MKLLVTYNTRDELFFTEYVTPKEKQLFEAAFSGLSETLSDTDVYWYPEDIEEMPDWIIEEINDYIAPKNRKQQIKTKQRFDDDYGDN